MFIHSFRFYARADADDIYVLMAFPKIEFLGGQMVMSAVCI
jgi:hypothetical protein